MSVASSKYALYRRALLWAAFALWLVVPGAGIAGASGLPPTTSVVTVSQIRPTTATVSGVANPEGQVTKIWFEYGTTISYGSLTPGQSLGGGTSPLSVSATLSGLTPATTYHVRLDVRGASGIVDGPDTYFTTAALVQTQAPATQSLVSMKVNDARQGYWNAVSCTRPASCWAVGAGNGGRAFFEKDLAGVWTAASVASPAGASLMGIDCSGVSSCWAVGGYGGVSTLPLAMHFNGRSWTRVAIAAPPGSFGVNDLSGVDCLSVTDCWAVGISDSPGPMTQRLIEHWNGRVWSVWTSPNPGPGGTSYLNAVSCSSADSCWAVGDEQVSSSLVMHWNGSSWTLVSSPAPTTLSGVSCEWDTACFAVGALGETLRLIGGVWHAVGPSVPSANTPQSLAAVSCSGPDSCWSVGSRYAGNGSQSSESPAAETWNGTRWAGVVVEAPIGVQEYLNAVTCSVGEACVSIGVYETSRVGNRFHFFADQT